MTKVAVLGLVLASVAAHALLAIGVDLRLSSQPVEELSGLPAPLAVNVRTIPVESVEPSTPTPESPAANIMAEPPSSPASIASFPQEKSTASGPTDSTSFFGAHEVDTTAEPVPQWQLDPAELAAAGLRTLSFAVWVDARGVAVQCKVLSMTPAGALNAPKLAARLCTTTLIPAVRRGAKVASVRYIELMLTE